MKVDFQNRNSDGVSVRSVRLGASETIRDWSDSFEWTLQFHRLKYVNSVGN